MNDYLAQASPYIAEELSNAGGGRGGREPLARAARGIASGAAAGLVCSTRCALLTLPPQVLPQCLRLGSHFRSPRGFDRRVRREEAWCGVRT